MALTNDCYEMQASRTDARFSTYSGAPSLQPSLAPTLDTQATSHRASTQPRHQYIQTNQPNEKPGSLTTNKNPTTTTNSNNSNRMYSALAPAALESSSTLSSSDPKTADLKSWSGTLERMQDVRLDKQRYVMSGLKSDEVSKLALGAKVERALARRMTSQDAVFRVKRTMGADVEKAGMEVEAN
ncbi:hypothetical protein LTR91_012954 [Friedmanniomyces endolithicus]|uniref:Uncharacterized protein n=1 Tax=Friedmanniomyces endolithicus TaxID=329885 RepID=A0A4U0UKQ6_9PEZI|nr:hypothetical protein LTS09_013577 [Friedmanniomyces endolithicus]KAK0281702.1 hypothetical protein LTR35_007383 [Friedmanniomyces endolithicus]KAK0297306.1 hypothetical protein LTS00_004027 [Friedmanniomyces endolithicus]KAK0315554.1 hypothetical protein LTR01_000854 [Friedmanniomyces endolithicus]KAK0322953.1 hypothetical protein LTR82_005881 [Friedmanniomyces endolithicus]